MEDISKVKIDLCFTGVPGYKVNSCIEHDLMQKTDWITVDNSRVMINYHD